MTTMADGLEAQDSSKSAFMEFGQQSHSQQSSPSMAASHYPLHCLHSGSHHHHHHQHDSSPYSGSNSYNRSLPYSYVSHPHHSPYLPSYTNASGTQTRLDATGKRITCVKIQLCFHCWTIGYEESCLSIKFYIHSSHLRHRTRSPLFSPSFARRICQQ